MKHLKRKKTERPIEFDLITCGLDACDELWDFVDDNNQSGTFVWAGVRVTMEKMDD